MNKKLFMMALCMVGHSGYAVEPLNPQQRYVNDIRAQLWLDTGLMKEKIQVMKDFLSTNPNADQLSDMLDKVLVDVMAPVNATWEQVQKHWNLYVFTREQIRRDLYVSQDSSDVEGNFKRALADLQDQWHKGRTQLMNHLSPEAQYKYETEHDALQRQQYNQALENHRQQYEENEAQLPKMEREFQYRKLRKALQAERETLKEMTKKLQEYNPTTNAYGPQMVQDAKEMVKQGEQLWAEFIDAEDRVAHDTKDEDAEERVRKAYSAKIFPLDSMGDNPRAIFKQDLESLEAEIKRVEEQAQQTTERLRTAINNNKVADWLDSKEGKEVRHHLAKTIHEERKAAQKGKPSPTAPEGGPFNRVESLIRLGGLVDEDKIDDLVAKLKAQYGPNLDQDVPQAWIDEVKLPKGEEAIRWIRDKDGGMLIFYALTADMKNDPIYKQKLQTEGAQNAFWDWIKRQNEAHNLHPMVNDVALPTDPVVRNSLFTIITSEHGNDLTDGLPQNQRRANDQNPDSQLVWRASRYQDALRNSAEKKA